MQRPDEIIRKLARVRTMEECKKTRATVAAEQFDSGLFARALVLVNSIVSPLNDYCLGLPVFVSLILPEEKLS